MAKTNIRGTQIADGSSGVDLTVDVFGVLPVANGGTGVTNPTAGRFMVGNGTSVIDLSKLVPTGAVVGDTDTQTLTNKTLTTPVIDSIKGANGLTVAAFGSQTSAVNFLQFFNNVTGGHTRVVAAGSDPNVGINLVPKGTGAVMNNGVALVDLSSAQVLTNKDLTSGTNTFPPSLSPTLVRASTTGQLVSGLTGPQTIDGVSCIAGDRVIVRHQGVYGGNTFDNGIWVVAAGAWSRATDANTAALLAGLTVKVTEGTLHAGTEFRCAFATTDTLGTTSLAWINVGGEETGTIFSVPNMNSRSAGATFQDANSRVRRVWTGAAWINAKGIQDYSSTAPTYPVTGELWYDPSDSGVAATAPFFKGLPVTRTQAITAGTNIPFTASEDTNGGWNASTNLYTVPVSGLYRATCQVKVDGTNTHVSLSLMLNGAVKAWSPNTAGTAFGGSILYDVIRCVVGDTLAVRPQTTDALQDDGAGVDNSYFIVEYVRV